MTGVKFYSYDTFPLHNGLRCQRKLQKAIQCDVPIWIYSLKENYTGGDSGPGQYRKPLFSLRYFPEDLLPPAWREWAVLKIRLPLVITISTKFSQIFENQFLQVRKRSNNIHKSFTIVLRLVTGTITTILVSTMMILTVKLVWFGAWMLKCEFLKCFLICTIINDGGYPSRDESEHKRPRKWTIYNVLRILSKAELLTLKNKKSTEVLVKKFFSQKKIILITRGSLILKASSCSFLASGWFTQLGTWSGNIPVR